MTNKEQIINGINRYQDKNKDIEQQIQALKEKIAELEEQQYQNVLGIRSLEGSLLEINEIDGEESWTW